MQQQPRSPSHTIHARRWNALGAVIAGALALVWPAIVNGYPLLFSDTGAFLFQALGPYMIWDKPWVYGPFLYALHARTTLWLPLLAQGLLLSSTLRLLARAFGLAAPVWHLAACATIALATAAPWSTALLMPDFLTPVVVMSMFLLAFAGDRLSALERWWLFALASFAIATHLSHLVIAAGCILVTAVIVRRLGPPLRLAAPLAVAMALLVATNVVGNGRVALSPYGAVFALARIGAEGIVEPTLRRHCPAAGWRLCGWIGRLPADSDEFLWKPDGPVYSTPGGPIALAPEAGEIVAATLAEHPVAAARDAARSTAQQLVTLDVGDTLGANALGPTVGLRLRQYFPAAEQARFANSIQVRGELAAWAEPFVAVHRAVLIAGAIGTLMVGVIAWRRADAKIPLPVRQGTGEGSAPSPPSPSHARAAAPLLPPEGGGPSRLGAFVAFVLVGVLANAFATGALSGPHHRYQARIAWLLVLPPLILLAGRSRAIQATRGRTSSGVMRTSAS